MSFVTSYDGRYGWWELPLRDCVPIRYQPRQEHNHFLILRNKVNKTRFYIGRDRVDTSATTLS